MHPTPLNPFSPPQPTQERLRKWRGVMTVVGPARTASRAEVGGAPRKLELVERRVDKGATTDNVTLEDVLKEVRENGVMSKGQGWWS
jgi:hypothetical protein